MFLIFFVLKIMLKTTVPKVDQIDVFKVQLTQSISRSNDVQYLESEIHYVYDNELFIVKRHGNRIIREPGYEILLEDVVSFEIHDGVFVCTKEKCVEI